MRPEIQEREEANVNMSKVKRSMLALVVLSSLSAAAVAAAGSPAAGLSVEVRPVSQEYVLGEMVKLSIRITNPSDRTVTLPEPPSVANGRLRVLIAAPGEGFKRYEGPGWGLQDVAGRTAVELAPGQSLETQATILYNHHQETSHLAEPYAARIARETLTTDFGFAQPGTYRIQVVLAGDEPGADVASAPAQIQVTAPAGADLEVWKALAQDPELAYFIQAGIPKSDPRSSKATRQAQVLLSLLQAHPESRQAVDIQSGIARYNSALQKLRALTPRSE